MKLKLSLVGAILILTSFFTNSASLQAKAASNENLVKNLNVNVLHCGEYPFFESLIDSDGAIYYSFRDVRRRQRYLNIDMPVTINTELKSIPGSKVKQCVLKVFGPQLKKPRVFSYDIVDRSPVVNNIKSDSSGRPCTTGSPGVFGGDNHQSSLRECKPLRPKTKVEPYGNRCARLHEKAVKEADARKKTIQPYTCNYISRFPHEESSAAYYARFCSGARQIAKQPSFCSAKVRCNWNGSLRNANPADYYGPAFNNFVYCAKDPVRGCARPVNDCINDTSMYFGSQTQSENNLRRKYGLPRSTAAVESPQAKTEIEKLMPPQHIEVDGEVAAFDDETVTLNQDGVKVSYLKERIIGVSKYSVGQKVTLKIETDFNNLVELE